MHKLIFCSIVFLFVSSFSPAQEVNSILLRKAETHFANKEWREAAAMFNVLINESPTVLELYPYAVASNDLGGNKNSVMSAVELSEKSGIPLDSLLIKTYRLCTALGYNAVYERMLLSIKKEQPWFKRIVNRYLLVFYEERKENKKALDIINEMLVSHPDNIDLLNSKAMVLADSGELQDAVGCMEKIIRLDSTAREARLFLGNFYFITGMNLYEKWLSYQGIQYNDTVSAAGRTDTVNYKSKASSMLLRAAGYLNSDGTEINTPYVRNTLSLIREKLKVLSDSAAIASFHVSNLK